MDEKNLGEPIGDSPGGISDSPGVISDSSGVIRDSPGAISDTRGPEVEKKKRDYDPVQEKAANAREYSFSFSHNAVNTDVESRQQC